MDIGRSYFKYQMCSQDTFGIRSAGIRVHVPWEEGLLDAASAAGSAYGAFLRPPDHECNGASKPMLPEVETRPVYFFNTPLPSPGADR